MTGATRLAKVLAMRRMMSAVLCAGAAVDVVGLAATLVRGGLLLYCLCLGETEAVRRGCRCVRVATGVVLRHTLFIELGLA